MQIFRTLHLVTVLLALSVAMSNCGKVTDPPEGRSEIAITTANFLANVTGIVDPTNTKWPRVVEGLNGMVTIPAKPHRIINASVGHAEITYAIVSSDRVIGVGVATKDPTYSNVAGLSEETATISSDPEVILAEDPDIIVTSPFLKSETVAALTRAGVPVIQTGLLTNIQGQINSILLMGYIYGEEDRALALATEVQDRYNALQEIVSIQPQEFRSRVLSLSYYGDSIYTAGDKSTEGNIIESAGGINVASEMGLEWNPTISIESIISMNPDIIIIPQPAYSRYGNGEDFKAMLASNPVLANVEAIRSGNITLVDPKFFTTLSFWNIRGVEELAKLLWPGEIGNKAFPPFSMPD